MSNLHDYYQTSDLAITTFLSIFFPIDTIDKSNPERAIFQFKHSPDLDRYIEAYFRDEQPVSPRLFFAQLKFIKSRLYENS